MLYNYISTTTRCYSVIDVCHQKLCDILSTKQLSDIGDDGQNYFQHQLCWCMSTTTQWYCWWRTKSIWTSVTVVCQQQPNGILHRFHTNDNQNIFERHPGVVCQQQQPDGVAGVGQNNSESVIELMHVNNKCLTDLENLPAQVRASTEHEQSLWSWSSWLPLKVKMPIFYWFIPFYWNHSFCWKHEYLPPIQFAASISIHCQCIFPRAIHLDH